MAARQPRIGDAVVVTRTTNGGTPSAWKGVILAGDAATGFELRGHNMATRSEEHSWFDGAERLLQLYGCVQTVTPAAA